MFNKENIKIIVCDMDGTLLHSDHYISEKNLHTILELENRGYKVVIATGRAYQLVKPYFDVLNLQNPFIFSNGGEVSIPYSKEPLKTSYLKDKEAVNIMDYCKKNGMIYLVYTRDAIYSEDNFRVRFFKAQNALLEPHQQAVFKDMIDHNQLVSIENIIKILIVEIDRKVHSQAVNDIKNLGDFEIAESQTTFIDVNPKGVNKGSALQYICEYYNVDKEHILAFGDQDNDVDLLQAAGYGVAMANGSTKAKEAADFITSSNDNDGVSQFIHSYLLND